MNSFNHICLDRVTIMDFPNFSSPSSTSRRILADLTIRRLLTIFCVSTAAAAVLNRSMKDLISEMNGLANASWLSQSRDPQMRLCSNLIIDLWYFSSTSKLTTAVSDGPSVFQAL
ncbi:hypothetical protein ACS0TY_035630 [Phlomoides rotata]